MSLERRMRRGKVLAFFNGEQRDNEYTVALVWLRLPLKRFPVFPFFVHALCLLRLLINPGHGFREIQRLFIKGASADGAFQL